MDHQLPPPSRHRLATAFLLLGGLGLTLGLLLALVIRLELQLPGVQWLTDGSGAPDGGLYQTIVDAHRVFTTDFGVLVLLLGGLGLPFAVRSSGGERIAFASLGWLSFACILIGAVGAFAACFWSRIPADLTALGSSEEAMRAALILGRAGLLGLSVCLAATVLIARDVSLSHLSASGWMYAVAAGICAAVIIGRWVLFGFAVETAEAASVPVPYGDLLTPVVLLASFAAVTAALEAAIARRFALGWLALPVLGLFLATIAVPFFGAGQFSSVFGAQDPFVVGLWAVLAGIGLIWLILFSLGMGRGWLSFGWGAAALLCMAPAINGARVVRSASADGALSDTYYVVAVLHFGVQAVALLALFAGIYALYPRLTHRPVQIGLSVIHLGAVVVGTTLSFMPQFFLGMQGMPRRYMDYPKAFAEWNRLSSIGTYVIAAGFVAFAVTVLLAWGRDKDKRERAEIG